MVRKEGLEPSRGYPLEPKSSASTSSATFAELISQPTAPLETEPTGRPYGARSIPERRAITDAS